MTSPPAYFKKALKAQDRENPGGLRNKEVDVCYFQIIQTKFWGRGFLEVKKILWESSKVFG